MRVFFSSVVGFSALQGVMSNKAYLKDDMTFRSRGPIPLYYGIPIWYMNLKPF